MRDLEILDLSSNQLSGDIPSALGNMARLPELNFSTNSLTGSIPVELRRLTNLVLLKLAHNAPTWCLPSGLSEVADNELSVLELVDCAHLTDPDRLVQEIVYLATNGSNWRVFDNWMNNLPLADWYGVDIYEQGRVIRLSLEYLGLTGTIPAALGQLAHLESLRLANNQLTGQYSRGMGGLAAVGRGIPRWEHTDGLHSSGSE